MFILNPGDGHDVQVFRLQRRAVAALKRAALRDSLAKLYCVNDLGSSPDQVPNFGEYCDGQWFPAEMQSLPFKVIDARWLK